MKKFRLYSSQGTVEMLLTYGADGFLVRWDVTNPFGPVFWRMLWRKPPLSESALLEMMEEYSETFICEEVAVDLSFSAFWAAYGHKVGNKGRAEKLWNALGEGERMAALRGIAVYKSFLVTRPTMETAFPETWLRQRRWEN